MEIKKIQGDLCHDTLRDKIKQKYAFNPNEDFEVQKKRAKEKLIELLGMEDITQNKADDAQFEIEEVVQCDGYTRTRFTFQSEVDSIVPCYILIPDGDKEKYPLAITLQGHSTGFHNSIGIPKSESDVEYITRGDFAVQAVKEGFVALAIEQRCMGERITSRHTWSHTCEYPTLNAIMMGRTSIGERIFDISCAIDHMDKFDKVDTSKIFITGNSGGGTVTF